MTDTAMADDISPKKPQVQKVVEPTIWNAIPHYLPLGIFPLIILAAIYGGWWLLPAFIFMSVTGLFDKLLGVDGRSFNPKTTPESRLLWHNLPVWLWAVLWPITLIFGMWHILILDHLSVWESIGLGIILAMEAQGVFVIGHEMIHRRRPWERRVGEFLLASASYPTYATEHVYIHHAKVGTPYDVGSAPKGESFWTYFPKELVSNITNSWQVDRERLARRGFPVWHYTNPFWRYGAALVFWHGVAYSMGGIWAIPVFAFLGFGCVFSMKISNYLQHYGLRRVMLPNGRWEKVAPRHSWSSDFKFSNWMFLNMQRHADHHATASRHYPLLQVCGPDESPSLPGTYADMMNVVIRPKRWFKKMDPLVDQWREHFYPDMDDWSAYDSPVAMARPDDFAAIVEIFGRSQFLAAQIEQNPNLLDSLKAREFTDLDLPRGFVADAEQEAIAKKGLARVYWTHEMSVREMIERLREWPAADADETAQIVQGWSNDKAFQVSMHAVRGNLTLIEAQKAFSNLMTASSIVVFDAVVQDIIERSGPIENSLAVLFLGDLATGDASIGSDIDLLVVHDGDENESCRLIKRRLQKVLLRLTNGSLLFAASKDADELNLTMLPLRKLHAYCQQKPNFGINLLTKSRLIHECGESDMRGQMQNEIDQIQGDEELALSLAAHLQSTSFGRASSAKEGELEDISEFLTMAGGPLDVNQAAQKLQLSGKVAHQPLEPLSALEVFTLIEGEDSLRRASLLWSQLVKGLALTCGLGSDVSKASKSVKSSLIEMCEMDDINALTTAIQEGATAASESIASMSET